eukprot:NODE_389_length_2818_cov_40.286085_g334_i0.p1 GENE.NODE_389_length_2818_cov_40.286085_g334_i0~~NODE_389_length_2818_cov_40.286085_g334_i0.p1  ORF type:complete len:587 (-),score=84.94 NODE_389_length_2818_cov_40.286085_g334_i0:1056-2762(-)
MIPILSVLIVIDFIYSLDVNTPGTIVTIAGNGTFMYGGDNGPATSAAIYKPYGLFKQDQYVYVADFSSDRIRRIDLTTASIVSFAGSGVSSDSGDGGSLTSASIFSPSYTMIKGTNLWISCYNGHRIRKVDMNTGTITTFVGTGAGGFNSDNVLAANTWLFFPDNIVMDSSYMWIGDVANNRVRRVDLVTTTITTYAGNGTAYYNGAGGPATSFTIDTPHGLYLSSTYLFIASYNSHTIYRVTLSNQNMVVVAGNGHYGYLDGAATSSQFFAPWGMYSYNNDKLWIADLNNNRIRLFQLTLNYVTTYAGETLTGFQGDGGQATAARLCAPVGITGDSNQIFFSDSNNYRVRRIAVRRGSASILGDPHFVGLSGGKYTLDLEPHHCYVIFTSSRLHWNSCAVRPSHRPVSYLGSMGFWIDQFSFILPNVTLPPLCIIMNQDKELCPSKRFVKSFQPSIGFKIIMYRTMLLLITPCFKLRIDIHIRLHSSTGRDQRRKFYSHFNAIISSVNNPDPFCYNSHGLLGVTMNKPAVAKGKNGEGVIEGSLVDYEVPNVLSTQFKYNIKPQIEE